MSHRKCKIKITNNDNLMPEPKMYDLVLIFKGQVDYKEKESFICFRGGID